MTMIGKEYIYNKTKNKYKVVGESLMKNPVTREWQECVLYKQNNGELEPMSFVREKKEFLERFTEVSPNWVNMYYGLSGTFKSTTINKQLKYDEQGIAIWSNIKTWKIFENKLFPGLIPQSNLNYALLHLVTLQTQGVGKAYGNTYFIERGITDMLYYQDPNMDEDIIRKSVEAESGIVGDNNVQKILLIQKDVEFLKEVVLKEKTRSEVFPGGVQEYLEKQDKYIEFTKTYNKIDKEIVINNAKDYIESLGIEFIGADYNKQIINKL